MVQLKPAAMCADAGPVTTDLDLHGGAARSAKDTSFAVVVLADGGGEPLERTLRSVARSQAHSGAGRCALIILEMTPGVAAHLTEHLPREISVTVLDVQGRSRWAALAEGSRAAEHDSSLSLYAGEELTPSVLLQHLGIPVPEAAAARTQDQLQEMNLTLGAGCVLHPGTVFEGDAHFAHGFQNYRPGKFGAFTYSHSPITVGVRSIGRYCSIAPDVLFGAYEHPTTALTTSPFFYNPNHPPFMEHTARRDLTALLASGANDRNPYPDIHIENDVWIGARACIKGGVTLGTGCIVGTGAVVTKDVVPYSIVGGSPARVLRMRFSQDLIEKLLTSAWWRYDPPSLAALDLTHPEHALDQLHQLQQSGALHPWTGQTRPLADLVPGLDYRTSYS